MRFKFCPSLAERIHHVNQKPSINEKEINGHTVIFDILEERYINDEIRRMYNEWIPVLPIVHVALGVAREICPTNRIR